MDWLFYAEGGGDILEITLEKYLITCKGLVLLKQKIKILFV